MTSPKTETRVDYIVAHGVASLKQRRQTVWHSLDAAQEEFKKRQAEGVHVDVFRKTTVVTTEKLT